MFEPVVIEPRPKGDCPICDAGHPRFKCGASFSYHDVPDKDGKFYCAKNDELVTWSGQ
jgi:hypothetical protein